jgi:hypothetical protein
VRRFSGTIRNRTGILFVAESCPPPGTTISSVGTSSLVVFALTVLGWFRIR